MSFRFHVDVLGFHILEEIEGSWTRQDFSRLLERLEFGDIAGLDEAELREMCVLSLQDLEPAQAAAHLLEHRLADALTKGQIQNISHEMLEEKLWEEYADMPLHERLFHVGSLLYQAFPRSAPVPDAVDVEILVHAQNAEGEKLLNGTLHESCLVRLLAHGMFDSAALNRLFGEAVGGAPFREAESIAWIVRSEVLESRRSKLRVIGSGFWLDALRETQSYDSDARPDA